MYESDGNWDDLCSRGPEDGKMGRWRQGSEVGVEDTLDYLVPQYKSPKEKRLPGLFEGWKVLPQNPGAGGRHAPSQP